MKKIILSLSLIASSLMADYEIIQSKTKSFSNETVVSKEVIYFGTLEDYTKYKSEFQKNLALNGVEGAMNGLSEGAKSLAMGFLKEGGQALGAGLAIGALKTLLEPIVMDFYADQKYIQVEKVLLKDGSIAFENEFFVGNKNPSYSDEEIKTLINKGN